MVFLRFFIILLVPLLLTQCSYDFSRRIIQQGNLIPETKVQRLRLGMSKHEVTQLMGSSLIHHIFDDNHIDYVYTWKRSGSKEILKYVCLTFQNNRLTHIEQRLTS